MFELEQATAEWRERAARFVPGEDLDELEAHLLDGVEERLEEGAGLEEAFVLSAHQLGDVEQVGRELRKESGKLPPMERRKRRSFKLGATWGASIALAILILFAWFEAYSNPEVVSRVTFELAPWVELVRWGPGEELSIEQVPLDLNVEIPFMRSAEVLDAVVRELNLNSRWDVGLWSARDRLNDDLSIASIEQSRLVEMGVSGSDELLVRQIANEIVAAYERVRRNQIRKQRVRILDFLDNALKQKADRVEEARLRMLDLSERYRISSVDPEINAERQRLTRRRITEAEIELYEMDKNSEEFEKKRGEINRLRDLAVMAKDVSFDHARKIAEYSEATAEYEMVQAVLRELQADFVRGSVAEELPIEFVVSDEKAGPAVSVEVSIMGIWWTKLLASWHWVVLATLFGAWAVGLPARWKRTSILASPFPLRTTQGGKQGGDDEIKWA